MKAKLLTSIVNLSYDKQTALCQYFSLGNIFVTKRAMLPDFSKMVIINSVKKIIIK